jgi:TRAP transporter 4TM/12TM fusion protein
MPSALRGQAILWLSIGLSLFILKEVNYAQLSPQSQLAIFALFGLVLCFLFFPTKAPGGWIVDTVAGVASAAVCVYVIVQTEPAFEFWWTDGLTLGDRAGAESTLDFFVGCVGVIVVLEATRRCLGWALPILASLFLAYGVLGSYLPGWLFPHRGYGVPRIVAQTFLHSQGVFGIALSVMFTYVFLFVLLGAFLEATGATGFIVAFAQRLFKKSPGGAAKVAVLSSGLMGSLSGSAVANTATTGTFTIPMMRSIGFKPHIAAGVTAAASSGGALVPPVMGAGAYMMLELVSPAVTYLEVVRAALIPAFIYYLALFLIVHFYSQRIGADGSAIPVTGAVPPTSSYAGVVFFATLGALIGFLLLGYTVFRAVSLALAVILALSSFSSKTRLQLSAVRTAFIRTAKGGVPLVAAAASVGLILGIVTLTGIGTKFPSTILLLSGTNLLFALVLIMVGSIVLGMGLPSAVCYLLMATLIGPIINELGIVPLAAHFFIFYFGMMSMVTPPVALAAYAAASIAECDIMRTAFAAFRFSLVGFTLPFMFVFRPELLFLSADGSSVSLMSALTTASVVIFGLVPLAAGIAGYLRAPLSPPIRAALLLAAALLFYPGTGAALVNLSNGLGLIVFALVVVHQLRAPPHR